MTTGTGPQVGLQVLEGFMALGNGPLEVSLGIAETVANKIFIHFPRIYRYGNPCTGLAVASWEEPEDQDAKCTTAS